MKTVEHKDIDLIETIVRKCDICFVGVVTPENTPYVLPMNFGYESGVIYLHSAPTGRVITALEANPNICVTFSTDHELAFQHPKVACSYRMKSKSVVAFGKVQFVDDMDLKRKALNIIMEQYSDKKFEYSDPAVRNVKIWVVPVDEMTCKEFGAPHDTYKQ
jgi:uncharacterized protein